jgi:hypothetical protein
MAKNQRLKVRVLIDYLSLEIFEKEFKTRLTLVPFQFLLDILEKIF